MGPGVVFSVEGCVVSGVGIGTPRFRVENGVSWFHLLSIFLYLYNNEPPRTCASAYSPIFGWS